MSLHTIQAKWNCNRLLATACGAIALFAVFSACSTVPEPAPINQAERVQRDQALGAELARQFESQLRFKGDKEILVYLRNVAQALVDGTSELRPSGVGVQVVQDRGGRWRNYGFPGNRIYLSAGLLKHVQYENELAAAIAFELAHVLKRHAVLRLQEERIRDAKVANQGGPADYPTVEGLVPSAAGGKPIDYFSPTGVFAFPDEFQTAAAQTAVEILYRAGYDPRGLVSLWSLYETESDHSPYDDDLLEKLLEKTRRVIALQSPLRNPIVRSQAFLTIQRRMQKL
jgi:predicted Zn-dependent protease